MLIPFALPSPIYFFSGSGFSGSTLHAASLVMAERACEGRRGSPRYQELVSFTQWKYQKRIKQDVGYKVWALYNDAVTLYVSYWKACYFCAAVSRALEALASPS